MNKKHFYGKMIIVFLLALFLANVGGNDVFIANTPNLRPNLGRHFLAKLNSLNQNTRLFIAKALNRLPEQKLKDIPLQQFTKGVYAKEEGKYSYTVVHENEVDWIEYTFVVNGKNIKVKVPQGQEPPTQELLERLY